MSNRIRFLKELLLRRWIALTHRPSQIVNEINGPETSRDVYSRGASRPPLILPKSPISKDPKSVTSVCRFERNYCLILRRRRYALRNRALDFCQNFAGQVGFHDDAAQGPVCHSDLHLMRDMPAGENALDLWVQLFHDLKRFPAVQFRQP